MLLPDREITDYFGSQIYSRGLSMKTRHIRGRRVLFMVILVMQMNL